MFSGGGAHCCREGSGKSSLLCHLRMAFIEIHAHLAVRIGKQAYWLARDGLKLLFADCYFIPCILIFQTGEYGVGNRVGADFDPLLCEVEDHLPCEHESVAEVIADQFLQFSGQFNSCFGRQIF